MIGSSKLRSTLVASVAACSAGAVLISPPAYARSPTNTPTTFDDVRATTAGAGIKVSRARIVRDGQVVLARVKWNQDLIGYPGHQRRFNIRLAAIGGGDQPHAVVLASRSDRVVRTHNRRIKMRLSPSKANKLRTAKQVVLSVSQQYDSPTDGDKLYEANYVSSFKLRESQSRTSAATRAEGVDFPFRDCSKIKLGPFADLSRCYLVGADLTSADLRGANLTSADLTSAKLVGTQLDGAELPGAKLTNTNLRHCHLTNANLREADLRHAGLRDADLVGASLVDADLRDTDLVGADLRGANLVGADVRNANLVGAFLPAVDLRGANLVGAKLRSAFLPGALLDGAKLPGADLRDARLTDAHLPGANLRGAELGSARLDGANLVGANLRGADLADADLVGAELPGADLRGADLNGANLNGANLNRATWTDGRECTPPSIGRCDNRRQSAVTGVHPRQQRS